MAELYSLPDGWEWKKLDDFVSIKGGKRIPKGKKLLETKTNYPYIRVTDFNDFGSIDLNNIQYITEDIYNEIKNYIISKDDIYISIAGTIGKTGIIPNELDGANLTENAAKFVFDNSKYDKFFLLYFTNSIPFLEQIGLATKTVAMPKLALTRLKEVEIPLPPFEEQKRIVDKLDNLFAKIDKAIALHQKNCEEADIFMASVLNDVFVELEEKYEIKTVDEVSLNVRYGYTDSAKDKGNAVFIRITDINENGKFKDNFVYVDIEDKELERFKLYKGDILVARSGATAGKVALFDLDFVSVFASYLIRIQPNSEMDSSFFFYFCHSPKYWEQLNIIKVGGAQPNVNATNLKEIKIATPPLQTQQKVVSYLDEVSQKMEKIKQIQKEKMQSLKALKASILDQAFKGEL